MLRGRYGFEGPGAEGRRPRAEGRGPRSEGRGPCHSIEESTAGSKGRRSTTNLSKDHQDYGDPSAEFAMFLRALRPSFDSSLDNARCYRTTWKATACSSGSPVTVNTRFHVPVVSPVVCRLKT